MVPIFAGFFYARVGKFFEGKSNRSDEPLEVIVHLFTLSGSRQ